jgi:hypothetical protein
MELVFTVGSPEHKYEFTSTFSLECKGSKTVEAKTQVYKTLTTYYETWDGSGPDISDFKITNESYVGTVELEIRSSGYITNIDQLIEIRMGVVALINKIFAQIQEEVK